MLNRLTTACKKIKNKIQNTGFTSTLCLKNQTLKQVGITS